MFSSVAPGFPDPRLTCVPMGRQNAEAKPPNVDRGWRRPYIDAADWDGRLASAFAPRHEACSGLRRTSSLPAEGVVGYANFATVFLKVRGAISSVG